MLRRERGRRRGEERGRGCSGGKGGGGAVGCRGESEVRDSDGGGEGAIGKMDGG